MKVKLIFILHSDCTDGQWTIRVMARDVEIPAIRRGMVLKGHTALVAMQHVVAVGYDVDSAERFAILEDIFKGGTYEDLCDYGMLEHWEEVECESVEEYILP